MKLPVWKPLYFAMKFLGFSVEWEVSVGAVIYRMESGERLYLVLHYPSGHYDFVKGHIEEGETEEETLRRETEEETGIRDLAIKPVRKSIRYFYVARGNEQIKREREGRGMRIFKQVHFYPTETRESAVRISHEHTGYEWLPYEGALDRLTFENGRRVLRATEEYLRREEK